MAGIGAWYLDIGTNSLEWTDEVFWIHDLEPGDTPTVEEATAFYPEHARLRLETELARAMAGQGPYDLELPLVTAQGRQIWVHTCGGVEFGADGLPETVYGTIRDITQVHDSRERMRRREERLALALDGAQDGVWDWNVETGDTYFAPRFTEILGYSYGEIPSHFDAWWDRVPEEDHDEAWKAIQACVHGTEDNYRVEFRMEHRDGHLIWVLSRGRVVERNAEGTATRLVGTQTDISEQVELRNELVAAKERAEEATRAKSAFLATMSHEIRTPMNGILGLSDLLLETPLGAEQRSYAESILSSGTALLSILNDILDLSRTEAGMVELESRPVDLRRCVHEVVTLLGVQTSSKPSLSLTDAFDDDVPPAILGDAGRLRQVLMNLVGNALKFTHEGSVDVRVTTTRADDASLRLRIAVHDTGIGISPEARKRIFEPFTQADASTTRKYGGTGLGLAISRRLIEQMGGVLECEPNGDRGTVFWFELPAQAASDELLRPRTPDAPAFDGNGARVLIAEDNVVNQLVAKKLLEKLGFVVDVCGNGQEAVTATLEAAYEIVFMDQQMPVMDGNEATRHIKARDEGATRPAVIALTANAMASDRDRFLEAGADDYTAKPIVRDELVAAILRVRASHVPS